MTDDHEEENPTQKTVRGAFSNRFPPLSELPWLTVAVAITIVFALQLRTAPGSCFENTAYPAVCAVGHLLRWSPLAVLALPVVHGSLGHLATNVFLLLFFGSYFEVRHARERYLVLLAVAGYGSIYVQLLLDALAGRPPLAIGLSGAVFAVAAAPAVADLPRSLPELGTGVVDAFRHLLPGAFFVGGWRSSSVQRPATSECFPLHPRRPLASTSSGPEVGLAYGVASRYDLASRPGRSRRPIARLASLKSSTLD